jgi:hypothetical protein
MPRDQKIRAVLFYLALLIFLIGLPFILSFALGYKFNPRAFKFSRTGLIDIKTQPPGARIYLDAKLLNEKTPASISELLPAKYNLRLELEKFYPWESEVEVEEGKASRLDQVILFPLRPNIKKLNKADVAFFWVDEAKARIYYVMREDNLLSSSDLEGRSYRKIGRLPGVNCPDKKYKISPDREKLLIFCPRQIAVAFLEVEEGHSVAESSVVLEFPQRFINNAFWHSDSFHLILISDTGIAAIEARPSARPVDLVSLNRKDAPVFYDSDTDTLFFMDSEAPAEAGNYNNVYRLDLSNKF